MFEPFNFPSQGDGGILRKIITIVKNVWNWVNGKTAKKISGTDSINDNTSLENIDKIVEIFADFKEHVHKDIVHLEQEIKEELDFYVEEVCLLLEENQEIATKYGIKTDRIEKKIKKISTRINGEIENEVSKKLSLDNAECRQIIKMIPGTKKETAMQDFLKKLTADALNTGCSFIQESIEELFEGAETEIMDAVETLKKNSALSIEQLQKLDTDDLDKKSNVAENARYLIKVCELTNEILTEE